MRFYQIDKDSAIDIKDIRSWRLVKHEKNNQEFPVLKVVFKNGDSNTYIEQEATNLHEILVERTVGM